MTDSQVIEFKRRTRSLGTELAAHFEQLIVSGHYPPGSALPAERQLATDLGVSRTSIRDAMAELEAKRLIVRSHGKQSMVAMPTAEELAFFERMHSLKERVDHVVEVENIVEPGLTAVAAIRATESDIIQLEAVIARSSEHLPAAESMALDIEFHYALARMTRNTFLLTLSGLGAERTQEIRIRAHATREARRACNQGHLEVAAAVSNGDPVAAEQAMRAHLDVVHGYMYADADAEEEV